MKRASYPRSLFATLGPTLALVFVYCVFFQRPLEQDLQRDRSRLQKLEATVETSDPNADRLRLASLSAEVRNLEQTLASSKAEASHLVAKRSEMANMILGSAVPATSMAYVLEIFERHGVRCLSSQPIENPTGKIPEALQPVVQVLTSPKKDVQDRFEFKLVVTGHFAEVQSALQELSVGSSGVHIVSLTMELTENETEPRVWTITAMVWEAVQ